MGIAAMSIHAHGIGFWFAPDKDPQPFKGKTPEECRRSGSWLYYPDTREWFTWGLYKQGSNHMSWTEKLAEEVPAEYRAWVLIHG